MSAARLINTPCVLLLSTVGDQDAHGNPTSGDPKRVGWYCELQQLKRSEPPAEGETSDTVWDLFLRPSIVDEHDETVEVGTGDAVEINGRVYEFTGDPWEVRSPFNGRASHIEATVRRVNGSVREVGS